MFKFLRKYNKWILAVGGTILMIAFLIPQAITGLSRMSGASGATWAKVGPDQEAVINEDRMTAQQELQIIQQLSPRIMTALGVLNDPGHWYLLKREAQQAGLTATAGAGQRLLQTLTNTSPEETMSALRTVSGGAPPQFVFKTLGELSSIQRMIGMYQGAARYSDRRMRNKTAEALLSASADIVVIKADPAKASFEPDQQQLQEQLDEYADVARGEGEYGFGYTLPNRFKIEWLRVDAQAVRESIENSDALNGVALRKYFQRNKSQFGTDGSATFDQVEDQVRQTLLDKLVKEQLEEIEKFGSLQLQLAQRTLERENAYLVLPTDWSSKQLSFEKLVERIAEQFNIDPPVYEARGDRWYATEDISNFGSISTATTDMFGQPKRLSALIEALKEFGGSDVMLIQEDVAGPPLLTGGANSPNRSIFFYRITDTDPSRPPESVDEVREQLVEDLRSLREYRSLEENLLTIREQAVEDGLLAIARQYDSKVVPANNLEKFNAQFFLQSGYKLPGSIPGLGQSPEVIEKLIRKVSKLPKTRPISEVPEQERTFVVPAPDQLALVVVRVTGFEPVTLEDFQQLAQGPNGRLQLQQLLADNEDPIAFLDDFSFDALAARHQFTYAQQTDEREQQPNDASASGSAG